MPPDLSARLDGCREYMGSRYGCHSGFRTPFHITLVPPFCLGEESDPALVSRAALEALACCRGQGILPLVCRVQGFSSFGERTLFARVLVRPEEKNGAGRGISCWEALRSAVYDSLESVLSPAGGCPRRDTRPFVPHITIANRDIPRGAARAALEYLSGLGLDEELTINSITVFERKGGAWAASPQLSRDLPQG